MQLTYRLKSFDELTKDELYDILAVRFDVFVTEQRCYYTDPDYVDQQVYHLLGTDTEGRLQAYLRIIPAGVSYHDSDPSHIRIGRVLCMKDARGKGVGSALMQQALDEISQRWTGVGMELSAQTYIASLYEKFGFRKVGEEYMEADIPHIRMICPASS